MADNYLKKAIELVQEAIAADNAQNYEDAFNKYMKALEWFELSQKCKQGGGE